jgi:Zn-dependent protease with chaperone function
MSYGAVLAWLCPALLDRLTRNGLSPRLSVVVWLSAIVVAAAVWVMAGVGVIANFTVAHWGADPVRYCLDVVLAVHRFGWIGDLVLIASAGAGVIGTALVARRIVHTVRRLSARSCEHAYAAHMLGAAGDGVVIVRSDERAAYCVAGRPSAIVVTSGAVSSLQADELSAVLAHERAHLRARHPQLMTLLKALAATLPRIPLVRVGAEAVGRLVEMSADDAAARRHGRETLLSGLVALAGQPRATGTALAAGDTAILARAIRLASPASAGARLWQQFVLVTVLATVIVAPATLLVLSHS